MSKTTCSFDGCERDRICKALCSGHYAQLLRGRDLRPLRTVFQHPEFADKTERVCLCGKSFTARPSALARGAGKFCSKECYRKLGRAPRGEQSASWKDDAVGYAALHYWVRSEKGAPVRCEFCGVTTGRLEWANASHEYRRDVTDWISLCKPCHSRYDMATCRAGHERTEATTWVDRQGYRHCRSCRNERLRMQRRGLRAEWDAQQRLRGSAIRKRFGASGSNAVGSALRN
jgi:hypothetical protein